MDFSIISWQERHYKALTTILVVVVSFALVFWCISTQFAPITTFFASVSYALFLFVAGIYVNYTAGKAEALILERADLYARLTKLVGNMGLFDRIPRSIHRVTAFQELTGRTEKDLFIRKNNSDAVFFNLHGTVPLSKDSEKTIGDLECRFIARNSELCVEIENIINKYVCDNRIAVKENSTKKIGENTFEATDQAIVDDAISFSIREWCQLHLIDPTNSTALIEHFERHINTKKLEELKNCYNQIAKMQEKFFKQAKDNITCLKKLYGKRIEYESTRLFEGAERISELYSELESARMDVIDHISELYDLIGDIERADPYGEPLDEIYSELQIISEKIGLK